MPGSLSFFTVRNGDMTLVETVGRSRSLIAMNIEAQKDAWRVMPNNP